MFARNCYRAVSPLLVLVLLVQTGCSGGRKQLEKADLVDPAAADSYIVTTRDGEEMVFISLHLEGDILSGTVRRTFETTVGEGELTRTNVANRYEEIQLPWSDVLRVEAVRARSRDRSILFAAGAIAVGVAAFLLLSGTGSETSGDGNGGGGGKDF